MRINQKSNLPFWDHVNELRKTILRVGFALLFGIIVAFFFREELLHLLLTPLDTPKIESTTLETRVLSSKASAPQALSLPPNAKILGKHTGDILLPGESITIEVLKKRELYLFGPLEGFTLSLKIAFWGGLLLSSPLIAYFLLTFLMPGLKTREKRWIFPFFLLSTLFITLGIAFAYKVTLPLVSSILWGFNASLGENLWGLGSTAQFALGLILGHGLIFELYVVLLLLIRLDMLFFEQLKSSRKGVIIATLLIAALLTPPDIFSQVLLALPLLGLYELAILYAYLKKPSKKFIES